MKQLIIAMIKLQRSYLFVLPVALHNVWNSRTSLWHICVAGSVYHYHVDPPAVRLWILHFNISKEKEGNHILIMY